MSATDDALLAIVRGMRADAEKSAAAVLDMDREIITAMAPTPDPFRRVMAKLLVRPDLLAQVEAMIDAAENQPGNSP